MTAMTMLQSTQTESAHPVCFRKGDDADSYTVFDIFEQTLADLTKRMGSDVPTSAASPVAMAQAWLEKRSLYEHLGRSADQFWIAERDGQPIGFSRAIVRGGLQQLTELFVLPGRQSGGVGRGLLDRAFPLANARRRSIIATADFRAQALYLKSGVYPRFPIYYFGRKPESVTIATDLQFTPISPASPAILDVLAWIDGRVLEFRRDVDHAWMLQERDGFLYQRDGQPVGYGYVGRRNGPFALLDAADFPAVLAHAESRSAAQGHQEFGLEVPMVNQAAVDYLLGRGFKLDSFMAVMMSDEPFGAFQNYVVSSPPFFL